MLPKTRKLSALESVIWYSLFALLVVTSFYARLVENIFKWWRSMESIFLKLAQYPIVETERLLLRHVTLDDAEAMFEYASDRENTRYTFPTNQSLEETKNNIAQFYLANPLGRWGIELKSNGQFIGTIDLHKIDTVLKKAAIGYIINKKYWKQGLTTEATRAVIELAFEKIGMNKLIAVHDKANPASGRVMEKSGMRYSHDEEYAALDLHEEGRIVTRVHYVLTKENYFANK